MKIIFKLAGKCLLHKKKHFLITLLGFVLSVSVVAAVFGITDSVLSSAELSANSESIKTITRICSAFRLVSCVMSIFTAYTAFSIDFEDKIKEIGYFISVGMSMRQRLLFLLFEGLIYALIALPIGMILGYAVGYFFYDYCVGMMVKMGLIAEGAFVMRAGSVILTAAAGVTVSLAASFFPYMKMRKLGVISSVKPSESESISINVSLRQTLLSKISEKLFGRIGLLASQNYDNNKRRYRSVSLALSCGATAFFAIYSFFYYPVQYYISEGISEAFWDKWLSLRFPAIFLGLYFVLAFLVSSLGSMRRNMEKRKREFAAYRSLGISGKDMSKIVFVEFSLFTVYAILFTAIGSLAANLGLWLLFKTVSVPELTVFYPIKLFLLFAAFEILVGVLMFLYSDRYIKRINIIDTIKEN